MCLREKSAQIREILISESAWEEMTCLFAPSIELKGKTINSLMNYIKSKGISFIPCIKYIDNIQEFDRLNSLIKGEKASYVESGVT